MNYNKIKTIFILSVSFLLSQDLFWTIVSYIYRDEHYTLRVYPCFQILGACVYCYFAICFTDDLNWVKNWFKKFPILKTISNFLITKLNLIAELFSKRILNSVNNEKSPLEQINKDCVCNEVTEYSKTEQHEKVLMAFFGLFVILIFICIFAPLYIIELITIFMNFLINILFFLIVCSNTKIKL